MKGTASKKMDQISPFHSNQILFQNGSDMQLKNYGPSALEYKYVGISVT